MAIVPSSMGNYSMNTVEEKEVGNGFEFTRRKKWPLLLLQELVGSALFCLKPFQVQKGSMDGLGRTDNTIGWKIIYISPCGGEMIGQKSTELENRDFLDLVYPADQPQLQSLFTSLLSTSSLTSSTHSTPSSTGLSGSSSGRSHTAYARILSTDLGGDMTRSGPVVWELRAHATAADAAGSGAGWNGGQSAGIGGVRLDGTVIPRGSGDEAGGLKGKAVWVMGRRVGSGTAEENAQSLDAFLELKLENEKLREELRELQHEIDDDDYQGARSYLNPITLDIPSPTSSSPTPSSPSASSSSSSPQKQKEKKKPGRPPKDPKDREREKKRAKKLSGLSGMGVQGGSNMPGSSTGGAGQSGSGVKEGGEGMHVCVTCGRTDSPEWRKGPLGPKTLCNACGLRWAKRNSTQPSRKERKAAEAANAARK